MNYEEYVAMGFSDDFPVKIILKGYVSENETEKTGVTEVVYISTDTKLTRIFFEKLLQENKDDSYYMVYSVPFDTDLTTLKHYPSIAISKEDLS